MEHLNTHMQVAGGRGVHYQARRHEQEERRPFGHDGDAALGAGNGHLHAAVVDRGVMGCARMWKVLL